MELYTAQMAKWRLATAKGIPFLDITVKTGTKAFAPQWVNLTAFKAGTMSEEEYTQRYISDMRASYKAHPEEWNKLINMEKVTIACYCPAGRFCHRLILTDIIEKICSHRHVPFVYGGELT